MDASAYRVFHVPILLEPRLMNAKPAEPKPALQVGHFFAVDVRTLYAATFIYWVSYLLLTSCVLTDSALVRHGRPSLFMRMIAHLTDLPTLRTRSLQRQASSTWSLQVLRGKI
jgi:hypothetical protein